MRKVELTGRAIAAQFGDVSRPAISQHLRVLRDAGLLVERRDGTRRSYRTRPEGLSELRSFLAEFWDTRLEALRQEAEQEQRSRDHEQSERPESSGEQRGRRG